MDPKRWAMIQDLLLGALELGSGERAAFVRDVGAADTGMGHELTSLLRAHAVNGIMDVADESEDEAIARLDLVSRALADRYRIEAEIGRGGMATVYRARDLKHGRVVAVKVLSSEVAGSLGAKHFLSEIDISARLRHPHILPLFDSGDAGGILFFVMPYIEGETLARRLERAGPLAVEDAIAWGRDVAEALDYAHAQGVVHRDIKPANILLEAGHAIVADFGIGRAVYRSGSVRLTEAGVILGTPTYMSPEQATGDEVDGRSDLYSLGCVLFEALAGRPPIEAASAGRLIMRRLTETAPSIALYRADAPAWLATLLATALAKDPADRPQSAADFLQSLRSGEGGRKAVQEVASTPLLGRPAVAVLPFANLSRSEDQEYFADGLTEDLITALSASRWFPVIARNSTFGYRGKDARVQAIAGELGARYVVEGSVRRAGNRVRINAQLIDGQSGQSVWARRYDRKVTDIFQIQDELSETISAAVVPEMGKAERRRAASRRSGELDAWESYQLGMWHFHHYTAEHFDLARTHFDRALGLDPSLVAAWVGHAETYYYDLVLGFAADPGECRRLVFQAAQRAVELDETDANARCALGRCRVVRKEHAEAVREFEASLQLNPSLAQAHYGLGAANVFRGSSRDAFQHLATACRLSPRDLYLGSFMVRTADAYLLTRRYEEAVEWSRRALQQSGFQWSRYATLLSALGHLGRLAEAAPILLEVSSRRPDFSIDFVRNTHLFTHEPDMAHFLDGLEKVGAPDSGLGPAEYPSMVRWMTPEVPPSKS